MEMSTFSRRYAIVRVSNRFVFGLLVVLALSACAVSSWRTADISQAGNAKVNTENAGTTADDERKLDLVVSVDNQQWKIGGPILVKLRVHNAGKLSVEGICSFELIDPTAGNDPYKERLNLWAPVIVQAGGVQPAQGPNLSTFSPDQTVELEVDLNTLNWASVISNSWPRNPISQISPNGDYEFCFRIHVKTEETSEKIESNKVKVSIK